MVAFGVLAGYVIRDLKQFHHTYVLNDVSILRKDAADRYLMRVGNQIFEMQFCSDFTPDFDPDTLLKVIVYEDRGTCQSVSDSRLGYILARDDHGQPIKQGVTQ